jgi:uncharacterized protein YjiK
MPRIADRQVSRTRDTRDVDAPKQARNAAPISQRPTSELPGHLPDITKIDVENLAKKDSSAKGIKGASLVAEIDTGVKSPSGICHLPTGETLVVDDDKGIALVKKDGEAVKLVKDSKDVEGICSDDKGKYVYAVQEGSRKVVRYEVIRKDGDVELKESGTPRRLPKLKNVDNKGWEGLSFLSKEVAGGKHDHLVAVHEGSPRRIGIFKLPDLDDGITLRLPGKAKDLLPDLADITIDPKTGHLFVVSDESQQVVELVIKKGGKAAPGALLETIELEVVSSFELPVKRKSKPEGLAFDDKGRLWVSLDGNGKALVLELKR